MNPTKNNLIEIEFQLIGTELGDMRQGLPLRGEGGGHRAQAVCPPPLKACPPPL